MKTFFWRRNADHPIHSLMLELYLFIISLVAIVGIISHRLWIVRKEKKRVFKEQVAAQVEENREKERQESIAGFKQEYMRAAGTKKYDIARFKEEMRKAETAIARRAFMEAKKSLIQALSLTEDTHPVALKLADAYLESQDYRRAEALYRKLLEDDSQNAHIYASLGKIMLKKKDYKRAIQAYVRAVELDQKDDQKLISLGKIYHLMMRYSIAAECFKRAAEMKPREVEYLFLLADSCAADDDYENALFTYERILTIEPYNEKAKTGSQDMRLKMKEQEALFT